MEIWATINEKYIRIEMDKSNYFSDHLIISIALSMADIFFTSVSYYSESEITVSAFLNLPTLIKPNIKEINSAILMVQQNLTHPNVDTQNNNINYDIFGL